MIDIVVQGVEGVQSITGVQPVLIILVIIFVEPLAKLIGIKDSKSEWRNTWLGIMCIVLSLALTFAVVPTEGIKEALNKGLVLGGLSTLMYMIGKPVFKFLVIQGYNYLRNKFGEDLQDPDI